MTTWILILTLASYRHSSVASISGFQSQAACEQAATAWRVQTDKLDSTISFRTLCVPERLK